MKKFITLMILFLCLIGAGYGQNSNLDEGRGQTAIIPGVIDFQNYYNGDPIKNQSATYGTLTASDGIARAASWTPFNYSNSIYMWMGMESSVTQSPKEVTITFTETLTDIMELSLNAARYTDNDDQDFKIYAVDASNNRTTILDKGNSLTITPIVHKALVPEGSTAVVIRLTTTSSTHTSGPRGALLDNIALSVYVPVVNMSNGYTTIICGTVYNFYDSGGPDGNYGNDESLTHTFTSDNGYPLTITFTSYNTESCCDKMTIYDGNSTNATNLLNEFGGNSIPSQITSTSGSLTIYFSSDYGAYDSGWEATISCNAASCDVSPTNLSATNITAVSADLSWTAGGTETAWNIKYSTNASFDPATEGTLVENISTNPYALTGLESLTTYYVAVQARCSSSNASGWTEKTSFTTSFDPTAYLTVYDNGGTNKSIFVPLYLNGGYSNTRTQFVMPASTLSSMAGGEIQEMLFYPQYEYTALTATYRVYMTEVESSTISSFITPTEDMNVYVGNISFSGAQMLIDFDTPYLYNGGNLLIGLENITSASNDYREAYYFGEYVAGASVSTTGSDINYSYQRNFLPKTKFTYTVAPPTCFTPTSITVNNITSNTADLSWTAGAEETAWNIKYSTTTFNPATDAVTSITSDATSKTLTDLSANTTYYYAVQSDCGEDDLSKWSAVNTFTTLKNGPVFNPAGGTFSGTQEISLSMGTKSSKAQQTLINEGFEDGALPAGWTKIDSENTSWAVGQTSGNSLSPYDGSYAVFCPGNNNRGEISYLVSPGIDLTNATTASISYYYCSQDWSGDINELFVSYGTTATGPWTQLWTLGGTTTSLWTSNSINLNELCNTGGTYYFAFGNINNYGHCGAYDNIILTAEMPDGPQIYYTTDGTTPSSTNGTLYVDSFTINASTTVKAIGYIGGVPTAVTSETYTKLFTFNNTNATNNWSDAANWDGSTMPGVNDGALIDADVTIDANTEVAAMLINAGKTLTIAPNMNLKVSDNIVNNGSIVIESTESGTGSLLHYNAGVNGDVQRYIDNSEATNGFNWHLVSSPVINQSISSGSFAGGTVSGEYDFFAYDEENCLWKNYKNESFYTFNNNSDNFQLGSGYLTAYENGGAKTFTGELNQGPVNVSLSYNSTNTAMKGFNLVGNPYPSAIDWDASGWSRDALGATPAIYVYNQDGDTYSHRANYAVYSNGVGVNGGSPLISSGQGFFVKAVEAGTLGMTNDIRTATPATFRGQTKTDDGALHLVVSSKEYGSDEVAVAFDSKDNGGASKMYSPDKLAPALYLPYEGDEYCILMLNNRTSSLKLNFEAGMKDFYTIQVTSDMSKFSFLELEDLKENIKINLLEENSYTFSSSDVDNPSRFNINFKIANNNNNNITNDEFVAYFIDNELVIDNIKGDATINVIDIQGRVVGVYESNGSFRKNIGVGNGLYVIVMTDSEGVKTQKAINIVK